MARYFTTTTIGQFVDGLAVRCYIIDNGRRR